MWQTAHTSEVVKPRRKWKKWYQTHLLTFSIVDTNNIDIITNPAKIID